MKAFKALIPFLAVGLLVACGKQATKNGVQAPKGNPAPVAEGTGDWGGGNGIDNKVIEKYAVDITTLPEFKDVIEPIGEHLLNITNEEEKSDSSSARQNLFHLLASARTWIFAPAQLEVIEKNRIGVEFSKDPIDQLAIQSDREVWVDLNRYQRMDKDAKAALLMHELVMVHYRLRFLTIEKMCLITRSCINAESTAELFEKFPELADQYKPEIYRVLDKSDYEYIRGATVYLLTKYADIKSEADMRWFSRTFNFDRRMYPELEDQEAGFKESLVYNVEKAAIDKMLERLPFNSYSCNYDDNGTSKEKCRISIELSTISDIRKTVMTVADGRSKVIDIAVNLNLLTLKKFSRTAGETQEKYILQSQWQQAGNGASKCPSGTNWCIKYSLIEYKSSEEMKKIKVGSRMKVADLYVDVSDSTDHKTRVDFDTLIPREVIVSGEQLVLNGTNRQLNLVSASDHYDHSVVISRSGTSKERLEERAIEPTWILMTPN